MVNAEWYVLNAKYCAKPFILGSLGTHTVLVSHSIQQSENYLVNASTLNGLHCLPSHLKDFR